MTNEQHAIARLRADLARADAEGTPVEVNREDLREVIALAEMGAALDKCLEIGTANGRSVLIGVHHGGACGAKFVHLVNGAYDTVEIDDVPLVAVFNDTPTEALAQLALAALEAQAVTHG